MAAEIDGPCKLRLLEEYVSMYSSRVLIAQEDYTYHKVGVVAHTSGKIVPDMQISYLERDELIRMVNTQKPGVNGAMSLFDRAEESNVPFLLIFPDGDMLATLVRARLTDDPDAE